jgi:hypothetical protein
MSGQIPVGNVIDDQQVKLMPELQIHSDFIYPYFPRGFI